MFFIFFLFLSLVLTRQPDGNYHGRKVFAKVAIISGIIYFLQLFPPSAPLFMGRQAKSNASTASVALQNPITGYIPYQQR